MSGSTKKKFALITNATLQGFLKGLRKGGIRVEYDPAAGIAEAVDGEAVCLASLRKWHDGPWITRFIDTENVTWDRKGREKHE